MVARIDHSGEAAKGELSLRPTQVLVFGSPRGGTPVMQAVQTTAIELPLKALFRRVSKSKPAGSVKMSRLMGNQVLVSK